VILTASRLCAKMAAARMAKEEILPQQRRMFLARTKTCSGGAP
jgi:hypothetical protein